MTLTWENTWGRVDWETVTVTDVKRLLASGAGRCWRGAGPDGFEGYPDELAEHYFNKTGNMEKRLGISDYSGEQYEKLIDAAVHEKNEIQKMLFPNKVDSFWRKKMEAKKRYNEAEELKKDSWRDLNWYWVTPRVIHEMVKKGLRVNATFTKVVLRDVSEWSALFMDYRRTKKEVKKKTKPLIEAIKAKNVPAIQALLQENADPKDIFIGSVNDMNTVGLLECYGAGFLDDDLHKVAGREAIWKKLEAGSLGAQNKLTLERKGEILDAASALLRHKRETLMKRASEAGTPLSKEEIREMRDAEGRARAKKLKELLTRGR